MEIFQTIVNKYKDVKHKSLNKKEFKQALLQTASKEEIKELGKKRRDFGLSEKDVKEIKSEIFAAAFAVAKSKEVMTEDTEQAVLEMMDRLGLADDEIQSSKKELAGLRLVSEVKLARLRLVSEKELARLRLMNEIQQGNMPTVPVTHLIMQKGEKAYWVEPATLNEEKVLRRRFEGGSQGVSFRIMKGLSYRVSGFQGHSVSETGVVAVSNGDLIITSKRIVFRGDKKSFAVKLDKILDTQLFTNGLHFSENNRSKPRLIEFEQEGNHNIIGAILSFAINNYGDKE